ncbi:multidrug DMT transporter permease [Legionella quateirensis]|uniref:Ectonucleoside triphosphate diphosphohydrolase I n=1 Tax=Legionella quateirensis TaxID=45072 RepID=A0A378KVI6_9GAMM|nr:multidrug DMT transporter permease [Legionella quateirensis]KTD43634.1 ectonucleoside triphosphate diphosphohydrolase I [Legionella quateirensis]STY17378.1 ectonucleoside triphosphate diphosphohydrolase I [Legionella quateirensis]
MFRFLVIIACFVVISSNVYAADNPCTNHQCIAVIDAGSTGSRLHVFSYDVDETRSPININEIWNKKIKPGFATIEPNSNTIDAYLTTLLSGAPNQQIPVYFYATAGMRLLPVSKQKKYYDELQHWFSQQSQWQLVEAKTITGNDEALYDWLSVNYHLGTLQKSLNQSVGVMDMGGASVQIVFPIQKNSELNTRSQVELDLYGQHYTLYVQSFLGLGQTEVAHQFLNSAPCFSNDYPLPDGESGQGNASACEQEVSRLMTEVHKVNNVIQPLLAANPVDSWYSIGGISNLADSSLFHFENSKLTNQNLLQQADSQVCHQQWDSLNSQFPDDEYVYQYCLFSAYYYALMVDGYGIVPDQSINYIPPAQNLDWTMGVVLHH